MKNFIKLFVVTAFVVVIGFSMAACDNGIGKSALGDELRITGQQVYEPKYSDDDGSVSYTEFKGTKTLYNNYGGTGEIKDGKFRYTLGTPADTYFLDQYVSSSFFGSVYTDVKASHTGVEFLRIDYFTIDSYYDSYYLKRGNETRNISSSSISDTEDNVSYIYVDSDVSISGNGITTDYTYHIVIAKDFNLKLKKGWNVVRQNITYIESSSSYTYSLSLGDSKSCKWILQKR